MRRVFITLIILAGALLIFSGRALARQSDRSGSDPCNRAQVTQPNVAVAVLLQHSKHMLQPDRGVAANRMMYARRAVMSLAAVLDSEHDQFSLLTYNQVITQILPLAHADGGCVANILGENSNSKVEPSYLKDPIAAKRDAEKQYLTVDVTDAITQTINLLSNSNAKRNVIVIVGASCEDTNSDKSLPADALPCQPSPIATKKIIELSKKLPLSIYAIGVGRDGAPADSNKYFMAKHDELRAYAKLLGPANAPDDYHFLTYDEARPDKLQAFLMSIKQVDQLAAPTLTPTAASTPTQPTAPTATSTAATQPIIDPPPTATESIWWPLLTFAAGLLYAATLPVAIFFLSSRQPTGSVGSAPALRIALDQPLLLVKNGLPDARYVAYLLMDDNISIGSDLTNAIQLPEDAGVRKQHIRLERFGNQSAQAGSYTITLGAPGTINGDATTYSDASTYINNKPLRTGQGDSSADARPHLGIGDLLTIGKITLQYLSWPVNLPPPSPAQGLDPRAREQLASNPKMVE